jgi:VanZ family protein
MGIAVLSSVPGEVRPHLPGFSDKLEHVFAFVVLGTVTVLAAPRSFSWQRFLALSVSFAAVLEVTQVFVPGREASFLDLSASLTGAILGVSLGLLLRSPPMSQ